MYLSTSLLVSLDVHLKRIQIVTKTHLSKPLTSVSTTY